MLLGFVALSVALRAAVAAPADDNTSGDDPPVRLNTIGYVPDAPKRATIAVPAEEFSVVRIDDGSVVLSGTVTGPVANEDTQEQLYTADFSTLSEPGAYRLDVTGVGRSAPFRVDADLYRFPFYVVTRGMYLWRCGTAVRGTHNGNIYDHNACHLDDAYLDHVGGGHVQRDGTRGWHDAGDYNKYVVNAGVTVGCMFRAWDEFGAQIGRIPLDLPESGGPLPDFLAELKWEIDWLLSMQAPDGSVYHKLSTVKFCDMILPEDEEAERYFVPWSSAATADFVAMTAMAARYFREYDADYADRCLAAARKSYEFLRQHPENHRPEQRAFRTGGYGTWDPDDRLWAAAELWETTGDADVLSDLETSLRTPLDPPEPPARWRWFRQSRFEPGKFDANWDWSNVKNLALITYLFSERSGRDESLVSQLRASLLAVADEIVQARDEHGYARPLGTRYYWGCNGTVARQTLVLRAAYRVDPKAEYRAAALDALNHLFGRNCYGRSYVTGLGDRPPLSPHDRRSAADNVDAPWPGYLVGGPNPQARDWRDEQEDFRTNEIAVNWNGALIYALAAQLNDAWTPPRE